LTGVEFAEERNAENGECAVTSAANLVLNHFDSGFEQYVRRQTTLMNKYKLEKDFINAGTY
jgi:hypothetical protein